MPVPDLSYKVEVAFTSTWRTPAASRVWTDISAYVELGDGMSIRYGRQDERGQADANELTLTLDNSDGRFTFGNASSPYFPNVKIGRPIRVSASVGGVVVDSVRFVGFINEWPVAWSGGSGTAGRTTITASSRISRLGTTAPRTNPLDDTIVTDLGADYYWPMTEEAGSTKCDEIRGRAPSLKQSGSLGVEFGLPADDPKALGDSRPAVRLFNTVTGDPQGILTTTFAPPLPTNGTSGGHTVGMFVRVVAPAPLTGGYLPLISITARTYAINSLDLAYPSYAIQPATQSGMHHLAVTFERTGGGGQITTRWYFDGVQIDSGTVISADLDEAVKLTIKTPMDPSGEYREVTVGRLGVWRRVLSATELQQITAAGLAAFSGDTTDVRLRRVAAWAGVAAAETSASASSITMGPVGAGEQVLSLLRRVETTEAGVLYDRRDGTLRLDPRNSRYTNATALTVDATSQRLGPDYAPKVDRSALVNMATAKNAAGTVEITYTDEDSRTNYGDAGTSIETDALDVNEPYALASWEVNVNKEPQPRAPSMTANVVDWIGDAALPSVVGLDIGSRVVLTNLPAQAPSTTASYFVEGYTEDMGPGSWRISLNLSPTTAYDAVLVLDSSTRGRLDTNTLGL